MRLGIYMAGNDGRVGKRQNLKEGVIIFNFGLIIGYLLGFLVCIMICIPVLNSFVKRKYLLWGKSAYYLKLIDMSDVDTSNKDEFFIKLNQQIEMYENGYS